MQLSIKVMARAGTAAEWTSRNPVLDAQEIAFETDTNRMKMGDGVTAWNALPYRAGDGDEGPAGPQGLSAYQVAVANGFVGTQSAWLASLVGPAGPASTVPGPKGDPGDPGQPGAPGEPGAQGQSAYQVAVAGGFVGSEADWLASLAGPPGDDGADGQDGEDGASAYQIAVANGFVGTEAEWLASLVGPAGQDFDPAIVDEVVEARGQRSRLHLRISTISNFASPNAGGNIVGQFCDNAFHGLAPTTLAMAANRMDLAPFFTSTPLRIDQLGVAVSTAVAGSLLRCVIYEADSDGWPNELLYEGDTDLDSGVTGYRFHALDFTFDSGRQYWLGVRSSSTATIRAIGVGSAVNLGLNGSNGTNYFTVIRRTLAFATPAPALWNFVPADRAANVPPPSIRMRAAAL
jgi:hypothetical protein